MDSKRMKLMLATVGVGAMLAMGVVTVAGNVNAAVPQPVPAKVDSTFGVTKTATTPPTEPETTKAVPPIATAPYTIPTGEPQ